MECERENLVKENFELQYINEIVESWCDESGVEGFL